MHRTKKAIEHYSEYATFFLGSVPDDITHFISEAPDPFVIPLRRHIALSDKPLQEEAVYPILGRPVKVPMTA